MRRRKKSSWVESTIILALMGILAGAIGGLAIGAVTSKTSSSAAAH